MSFSTNSTNPLSAYNMTSNNLTAENLRNARFEGLNRNASERSSGSSQGSNGSHSQNYISMKRELFSNSSNGQKGFDSSTSSNGSGTSTLSGRVKNCSVL